MPHFFIVLFKINLVLLLFAAAYHLILRKLTFYVINRVFLLFGILFSTAYPFINLTAFFGDNDALPAFVPGLNQNVQALVRIDFFELMWQGLTLVFYAGMLFMAFRLLVQFISLRRVHRKSYPGLINSQKVRILNHEVSPFSFWQTIYVNPVLHKKEDLNNIIEHEKVHVEEWHTIDIILTEISLVFYWFNPGVWLMKKAVRENIEFITDAKILKKGIDKKAYQYSLLDVGALQPSVAIVNNFNLSDLRKRIKMMNAKRSSKVNLTRYFFVLPVLLCVTLAFTIDRKDVETKVLPLKRIFIDALPSSKLVGKTYSKVLNKRKIVNQPRVVFNMQKSNLDTTAVDAVFKSAEDQTFLKDQERSKKGFSTHFFFSTTDTMHTQEKPDVKNIVIRVKKSEDGRGASEILKSMNFIHLIGKSNISGDSLSAPKNVYTYTNTFTTNLTGKGKIIKTVTYTLNGNEVSQKDISKIMPDDISSITLSKEGFMDIKTRNK